MSYYLYGLHRSGTNILESSIGLNFPRYPSQSNHTNFNKTWKHSFVGSESMPEDSIGIIIYKNIYTWLESVLIRSPYDGHHIYNATEKQIPDFNKFIKSIDAKYHFVSNLVTVEGMIEVYFKFLKMHLLSGKNVHFVSYEDLLIPATYNTLMHSLSKVFNKPLEKVKPLPPKVTLSPNYNKSSENYYLQGQTRFLPQDIVDCIADRIDKEFMTQLKGKTL
jgi:hypothetical protein